MKELGIVRKLDPLGRITLPIELRRTLGIKENDPVEIYVEEDVICLKRFKGQKRVCSICGVSGEFHELNDVNGGHVCKKCTVDISRIAKTEGIG